MWLLGAKSSARLTWGRDTTRFPCIQITTPFGLLEYTRMPFGISNSSNTFQRNIGQVKNQLSFCFAFQEDLRVASRKKMEQIQHLCTNFTLLREHGLVINAKKCIFDVSSMDLLGHRVDAIGVTPLPQSVSVVVEFPQPSTVKEIQAFLEKLNFLMYFRPSITDILHPLIDSLCGSKKGSNKLKWFTYIWQAFAAAKQALTDTTYLAHPLPGAALILGEDASATHVGTGMPAGVIYLEASGLFLQKDGVCPDHILGLGAEIDGISPRRIRSRWIRTQTALPPIESGVSMYSNVPRPFWLPDHCHKKREKRSTILRER